MVEQINSFEDFMKPLQQKQIAVKLPDYEKELILREIPFEHFLVLQQKHTLNNKMNFLQFSIDLMIESMIVPNLRNTKLQEYYGVLGERKLLFCIIRNVDNWTLVLEKLTMLYGLDSSFQDNLKHAKNYLEGEIQ